MIFLRRFWTTCDAFLRRSLGRPIDATAFTRFIYSSRHLKDRYNAFMPPPGGELSVCQILGRSAKALFTLGARVRTDRALRGRAAEKPRPMHVAKRLAQRAIVHAVPTP